MAKRKRKIRVGRLIVFIILFFGTAFLLAYGAKFLFSEAVVKDIIKTGYYASEKPNVTLVDMEFNEVSVVNRGDSFKYTQNIFITKDNLKYYKLKDEDVYILESNISDTKEGVILETEKFVRTPVTVYTESDSSYIESFVNKGESLEIIGFDYLTDGVVNKYNIKYNDVTGYVYAKYLVDTKDEALLKYDNGNLNKHAVRTNYYDKNEKASDLDFYPYEKPSFADNVMPDETRTLYLNVSNIADVDTFIEIAKEGNINAFVVDIKDGQLAYKSEVAKTYSPNDIGYHSIEGYKNAIKKLKDAGFYVIGRICAFNDSAFASANKDDALTQNGNLYKYSGIYWPTPYSRKMWEYNVELAKEAVTLFGFNEIQYDYVRFTDNVFSAIRYGVDLKNKYGENKSQVIQNFLFYACDQLHELNVYVSADVFGESANGSSSSTSTSGYITGYGQYWPAISNVVDVISAMPYPDHFNKFEYGYTEPVWTTPYKLLKTWGSVAYARQQEATTPAKMRTWIQAYDTIREPYITYGAEMVSDQIAGLYDAGLSDGYMTWNAWSTPYKASKYRALIPAFKKEYKWKLTNLMK